MRVTLDTNVLVSAFISRQGLCADILDLVATFDEIKLVLSREILSEFGEVMRREKVKARLGYESKDISRLVEAVRDVAEVVAVRSDFKVVEEDPDDDIVVNTAIDGKAEYIVSGDRHLNRLKRFRDVKIVTPKAFLEIVTRKFGDLVLSKADLGLQ